MTDFILEKVVISIGGKKFTPTESIANFIVEKAFMNIDEATVTGDAYNMTPTFNASSVTIAAGETKHFKISMFDEKVVKMKVLK